MLNAGEPDSVPSGPKVTPDGRTPVSLKVTGVVPPVVVTAKVPEVFSLKVVDAAELNTGAPTTSWVTDSAVPRLVPRAVW